MKNYFSGGSVLFYAENSHENVGIVLDLDRPDTLPSQFVERTVSVSPGYLQTEGQQDATFIVLSVTVGGSGIDPPNRVPASVVVLLPCSRICKRAVY